MKPRSGVLAFFTTTCSLIRNTEKEPKNPTSLAGHFCAYSLLGTVHPQQREKTKAYTSGIIFPIPLKELSTPTVGCCIPVL